MLDEFSLDDTQVPDRVYKGKRLNERGQQLYRDALPVALREGTPETLQAQLEPVPGDLWITGIIDKRGHRSPTNRVAAETLAQGEFNRYYMRAICLRAMGEGDGRVTVRRAKSVEESRKDHLVKVQIGDVLAAEPVLEDLRRHIGEETEIGMPRGPGSGLSLEFTPPPS